MNQKNDHNKESVRLHLPFLLHVPLAVHGESSDLGSMVALGLLGSVVVVVVVAAAVVDQMACTAVEYYPRLAVMMVEHSNQGSA